MVINNENIIRDYLTWLIISRDSEEGKEDEGAPNSGNNQNMMGMVPNMPFPPGMPFHPSKNKLRESSVYGAPFQN